ncbi:S16 family serine protease [Paenibacillus sp. NPDC056579]|uniref:S16 family serine protease n=1 Tax=unclassified Paenibacillus TaxID=185978 RepID=UPI001EF98C82|nr:S16 family serine protease [Paenibacillus sp. H1-7]ULL14973.1 hypothetical protein DVH26_11285 [Paenibacillus sp. H1-7]
MSTIIRTIKKEFIIGFMLLLIPFTASLIFVMPVYHHFTTVGNVVSVRQLGVKGNVFFTYVSSGYTKNLYEKLALSWTQRDNIEFYPADKLEVEEEQEELEYEAERREQVIQNAVNALPAKDSDPESSKVERIHEMIDKSANYYGDSFGLMVAIGLVEESERLDLSRNGRIKIAGTGAISRTMKVGPVGGVRYKVLTAEREGMQYFLVPDHDLKSPGTGLSNKEEAYQVVQERHLKIKIVPVNTVDDAVTYLKSLK